MDLKLNEVEEKLELPSGFFDSLYNEDDWSFVVKLHSFLEALMAQVLADKIDCEKLHKSFTHIPMSNIKYGKVVFAEVLDLISKDMATYIKALSELRNMLAHDVKHVNIDINKYYSEQPKTKKKSLYKKFGYSLKETSDNEEENLLIFEKNMKKSVHISGLSLVYRLVIEMKNTKNNKLINKLAKTEQKLREIRGQNT